MALPWILTTPSSHGIGFAITRHLLQTTNLPIVATARKSVAHTKDRLLDGLDVDKDRLEVLKLDVTKETTITDAAAHCKTRFSNTPLRLALCLPGILYPEKSPDAISYEDALSTFKVNTMGLLLLMKHFWHCLPKRNTLVPDAANLPAAAVFALMSARVGSITDNSTGGWFSYRASKAAVNQIAKSFDIHLRRTGGDKAMCVALHPGTVKTGLSRDFWASTPPEKLFSPAFAAERLCEVIKGLGPDERGKFWGWDGKEIPP